MVDVLLC